MMEKNLMKSILKAAGYSDSGIEKGIRLGTVILDNADDFKNELPEVEPEVVTYEGVTYYIAYAN